MFHIREMGKGEHMDKELQMLSYISQNERVTQRQLAATSGLSLGSVNALLQSMINKDYIQVQTVNARTLRYVLTPLGKEVKAQKTYEEVVVSFQMISKVRAMTKRIIEEQIDKGYRKFYLYGDHDEVYKLVKMSLIEAKRLHQVSYTVIDSIDDIVDEDGIIITWHNKDELVSQPYLVFNVLSDVV